MKQSDFRILEDGVPQTISFFSKDELPLIYGVAIDTSGSTKKSLNQTIDAAQIVVRSNKPSDETSLIAFKDQPELLEEFIGKEIILGTLDSMRGTASRQSAVRDAVYVAVKHVIEYKPMNYVSRRALIIITDGSDNDSYYRLDELRKFLRKQGIQIFALGYGLSEIGKTLGKKKQQQAIDFLTEVTKETGGQAYFPQSEIELREAARQLSNTLHTHYVIGYSPSNEGKTGSYHKVSVIIDDAAGRDKRVALTIAGYAE